MKIILFGADNILGQLINNALKSKHNISKHRIPTRMSEVEVTNWIDSILNEIDDAEMIINVHQIINVGDSERLRINNYCVPLIIANRCRSNVKTFIHGGNAISRGLSKMTPLKCHESVEIELPFANHRAKLIEALEGHEAIYGLKCLFLSPGLMVADKRIRSLPGNNLIRWMRSNFPVKPTPDIKLSLVYAKDYQKAIATIVDNVNKIAHGTNFNVVTGTLSWDELHTLVHPADTAIRVNTNFINENKIRFMCKIVNLMTHRTTLHPGISEFRQHSPIYETTELIKYGWKPNDLELLARTNQI